MSCNPPPPHTHQFLPSVLRHRTPQCWWASSSRGRAALPARNPLVPPQPRPLPTADVLDHQGVNKPQTVVSACAPENQGAVEQRSRCLAPTGSVPMELFSWICNHSPSAKQGAWRGGGRGLPALLPGPAAAAAPGLSLRWSCLALRKPTEPRPANSCRQISLQTASPCDEKSGLRVPNCARLQNPAFVGVEFYSGTGRSEVGGPNPCQRLSQGSWLALL